MRYIGKIDISIYKCITENIITDDVIITDERIAHIKERRGEDFYDKYVVYFQKILEDPDYIFKDVRADTALVSKAFKLENEAINLVLRMVVDADKAGYKNSIITAIRENEKRFRQRLRNNEPIYKKLDISE